MALPASPRPTAYAQQTIVSQVKVKTQEVQRPGEETWFTNVYSRRRPRHSYSVTLRYTACGGLFNQQYSHIAALVLAMKAGARAVVWPPMQERNSFAKKYDERRGKNEQTWQYVNASSIWDMEATQRRIKERFGIDVIVHSPDCALPRMDQPLTAFQDCPIPEDYDGVVKFTTPIYLKAFSPALLSKMVHDQVRRQHQGQPPPRNVLVDLPCTLFSVDVRDVPEVEGLVRAIQFNPQMVEIANKVIAGIQRETGSQQFNGIHLRMERDASNWPRIVGGLDKYWMRYKLAMLRAGFRREPQLPLFVASGLVKSSTEDQWSKDRLDLLTTEILNRKFASKIVWKEMYLSGEDLQLYNEQSALVDFLVLQASAQFVGIGVSTFSFYLSEVRLLDGRSPVATELIMMPFIGTDQLFFTAALVATDTRATLKQQQRLRDLCRRPDLEPCFSPMPRRVGILQDLPEDLLMPTDELVP